MIKNLNKKKKAFTLVEVIIVLAIIAIIAAIAIPNLTKVRTESKLKADIQSAENIKKTTIMLLTDDTLKAVNSVSGSSTSGFNFTFIYGANTTTSGDNTVTTPTGKIAGISAGAPNVNYSTLKGTTSITNNTIETFMSSVAKGQGKTYQDVLAYFKDIKAPQADGAENFMVKVDSSGKVSVEIVKTDGTVIKTVN